MKSGITVLSKNNIRSFLITSMYSSMLCWILAFSFTYTPTILHAVEPVVNSTDDLEAQFKLLTPKVSSYESRLDQLITFTLDKYNIKQNIIAQKCVLGIDFSVTDSKDRIVPEATQIGPIYLNQVKSIELSPYEQGKSWGFGLTFTPQEKTLYFSSVSSRSSYLEDLQQLKEICTGYAKIESLLSAIKQGRSCQLKKDKDPLKLLSELQISSSPEFGFRSLHVRGENSPLGKGDNQDMQVALLEGKESFVSRFRAALNAKKSIKVQTFHFMGDESGLALGNVLIYKRLQGLDVELMMDYFTPFIDMRNPRARNNTYILYRNMMAAGIPVLGFSCHSGFTHFMQELRKSYNMGDFGNWRLSIHEKIWMTDDKEAIIGGMNIHNNYFAIPKPGEDKWRDQDIIIRGKNLVDDIKNIYQGNVISYTNNRVEAKNKHCFNPHKVGTPEFTKFYNENRQDYVSPNIFRKSKKVQHAEEEVAALKKGIIDGEEFKPKFFFINKARIIQSRPDIGETSIEDIYIDLINKAQKEIWLVNAYFIPTAKFRQALINAAARGVKVKILTNSKETNELTPVAYASRYYYKDLVDPFYGQPNEIEIHEWTGTDRDKEIPKGKKRAEFERGMLHAKFFVVDGKISIVGSYNFDSSSRGYTGDEKPVKINGNSEIIIAYEGQDVSDELLKQIDKDLQFTKKIDYPTVLKFKRPRGFGHAWQRFMINMSLKYENSL